MSILEQFLLLQIREQSSLCFTVPTQHHIISTIIQQSISTIKWNHKIYLGLETLCRHLQRIYDGMKILHLKLLKISS